MFYKLLADFILAVHFGWIIFMLWGFVFTLRGFLGRPDFLERWLLRIFHLIGIAYVSLLAMTGRYCPLTTWENTLRSRHSPQLMYPGSFIIYYLEKFVYPDIHPLWIRLPTALIAFFIIISFILRPPKRIKQMFFK